MDNGNIAETLNLVGALFSLDPEDERMRPILERSGPSFDRAALHRAYMDLFVGPAPLEAPPWGSVYLDEERVLYGASTTLLREFLHRESVAAKGPDAGPEDHFGTLCWLAAWLAAEGRMEAFDELLGEHLMPWAPLYLQELRLAAQARAADFYAEAAEFAASALDGIVEGRAIQVTRKRLFPRTAM